MSKNQGFLSVNLSKARDNYVCRLMVSRTDGDPPLSSLPRVSVAKNSVCRFKTFSCVPAPRPHVLPHAGVVPVHTGTF